MVMGEFIQKLIMVDFLVPLIKEYEKKVVYGTTQTSISALTDLSIDHDI